LRPPAGLKRPILRGLYFAHFGTAADCTSSFDEITRQLRAYLKLAEEAINTGRLDRLETVLRERITGSLSRCGAGWLSTSLSGTTWYRLLSRVFWNIAARNKNQC